MRLKIKTIQQTGKLENSTERFFRVQYWEVVDIFKFGANSRSFAGPGYQISPKENIKANLFRSQ